MESKSTLESRRLPKFSPPGFSEETITAYVYQSNYIEGIVPSHHGPGDPLFDQHVDAVRAVLDGVWRPATLHAILMNGLMVKDHVGQYRTENVWIGGKLAPHWAGVPFRMKDWEHMVSRGPNANETEKWAWRMHDHFECIHPFMDGNGRTGRLVLNALRLGQDLPWITIHIGEEQMAYYDHIAHYRDTIFVP